MQTNLKKQDTNTKQRVFDLEERTLKFSKSIVNFCKLLPKNIITIPLIGQLLRSATSIGANYLEANDALGKKDFIMRIKIARKESKETIYWLHLILEADFIKNDNILPLLREAEELRSILSAIIKKSV